MRRPTIHLRHVDRRLDTPGRVRAYTIEDVDRVGRPRPETLLRPEDL